VFVCNAVCFAFSKALACSEEAVYQDLRVFAAWYVLCVCMCVCAMRCVMLSVKPWHVVRRQCTKTCVCLLHDVCSVRVCVCNAVCYAVSKALACSEEAAYEGLRVFAAWYVLCVCLCAMRCVLLSVKPWHVVRRQRTKTCVCLLRGTCSVRVCVCNAVCIAFSKALVCSEEAVYQDLRVFAAWYVLCVCVCACVCVQCGVLCVQ